MSTSKTPAVAQEAAPYGLTKAGKPRKRPAPNREGICPVKGCGQNFQTRDDPVKVSQQPAHFPLAKYNLGCLPALLALHKDFCCRLWWRKSCGPQNGIFQAANQDQVRKTEFRDQEA